MSGKFKNLFLKTVLGVIDLFPSIQDTNLLYLMGFHGDSVSMGQHVQKANLRRVALNGRCAAWSSSSPEKYADIYDPQMGGVFCIGKEHSIPSWLSSLAQLEFLLPHLLYDFGWDSISFYIKLNNCNQCQRIIVSFQ